MRPKPWQNDAVRRAARLTAVLAVAGVLWLAVLPAVGNLPPVRRYIARNQRQQIDPSAKFYTELPAMGELLEKVRAKQLKHVETRRE